MKDLFGKAIQVGDRVIHIHASRSSMSASKGTVMLLGKTRVKVLSDTFLGRNFSPTAGTYVGPGRCIILDKDLLELPTNGN